MEKETKEIQKDVFLFWKKVSETTFQATQRFKDENKEHKDSKMCFAGRLDPLAQGWLVFLLNDAVYLKDGFIKKDKRYRVSVLIGVQTDTDDIFGLIEKENLKEITYHKSEKIRGLVLREGRGYIRTFLQKFSAFSSKHVKGRALFWWATEKRLDEIQIPTHEVSVYSLSTSPCIHICEKNTWLDQMIHRFENIQGDFRNKEIINQWEGVVRDLPQKNLFHLEMLIDASAGMYVRQLIRDISDEINIPLTVVEITREKVFVI